eukprot:1148397-Rhodomonas_salina.1
MPASEEGSHKGWRQEGTEEERKRGREGHSEKDLDGGSGCISLCLAARTLSCSPPSCSGCHPSRAPLRAPSISQLRPLPSSLFSRTLSRSHLPQILILLFLIIVYHHLAECTSSSSIIFYHPLSSLSTRRTEVLVDAARVVARGQDEGPEGLQHHTSHSVPQPAHEFHNPSITSEPKHAINPTIGAPQTSPPRP